VPADGKNEFFVSDTIFRKINPAKPKEAHHHHTSLASLRWDFFYLSDTNIVSLSFVPLRHGQASECNENMKTEEAS